MIVNIGANPAPVTVKGSDPETGKIITQHTALHGTTILTKVFPASLRLISLLIIAACMLLPLPHAYAQINGSPYPFVKPQFFNNNGQPAAGYKICTYNAGTNNPIPTYNTSALTVPNTNPLVLDSAGRAAIFLSGTAYKVILLTDKSTTTDCLTGSMVTVWSQDNILNEVDLLKTPAGAGKIGYQLNAAGSVLTNLNAEQQQHFELKADFGAKGDGFTNDTAALVAGMLAASNNGYALHVSPGTYRICHAAPSIGVGKTVALYGDGPQQTIFTRHSSCLLTNSDMIDIPAGTGAVYLHDFGIDTLNTTGSPANEWAININTDPTSAGPTSVTIDHLSCSHGSVACISIANANNVTYSNSSCDHSWNYCVSVQGAQGGTASPVYNHNFNFHGNTYIDSPVGLAFNFFVSDIAVTGEVFKQSTLAFIQVPHAYGVVSGVTFDGSPDYGSNIGPSGSASAIFNEGTSDLIINGGNCYNVTAPSSYCYYGQGSNLQIPVLGATLQLPLNRNVISNFYMQDSPGLLYSGPSTNATIGQYLTIDTPSVINNSSAPGIALSGVSQVVMSGTGLLDNLQTGGIVLDKITDWNLSGWKLHNTGVAVAATYPAIQIANTATLNGYISNTTITNDGGNSNSYCLEDDRLSGGAATQIRTQGNTFSGCTATLPVAAIPTLGAWNAGDFIQDFSGKLGYINIAAGSPGTWLCTGCGPFGIGGVATSGTTASIGLTNLNPLPLPLALGLYRVSWLVEPTNTCGTQGPAQVVLALAYNDGFANRTPVLATVAIGGSQTPTDGVFTAYISSSGSSGHLQYQTTYTACTTGTGSYNLNMMMEKLQ